MIMTLLLSASVSFSFVNTSSRQVREAMVFDGGELSKSVEIMFSAVLVKHDDTYFLFDSGLGRQVDAQYQADMALWRRPFFRYDAPVVPAADQLKGLPISSIVLSHAHWDHASGLHDFPDAIVWAPDQERHVGWPSQVSGVRWKSIPFVEDKFDMFGDGSVVLLPLFGHTPGSVGMLITLGSGSRYLFVGDVVWNSAALKEGRSKIWLARHAADADATATQKTLDRVRALERTGITVVPAHDGKLQRQLGIYPAWVKP
jgi:glyoxylase-like metal-dependent hydrolase (beta-lactamase superfamily II)